MKLGFRVPKSDALEAFGAGLERHGRIVQIWIDMVGLKLGKDD